MTRKPHKPSLDVPAERFEAWAGDQFARLNHEADIAPEDVVSIRVRPMDGAHEVLVDTVSKGTVIVGRLPIVEFAVRYGDIAEQYIREILTVRHGRTPEQEVRIRSITEAIRAAGPDATRDGVATALGRAGEWGEPSGDYKADVRQAGGWENLKRRALDEAE